MKLASLRCLLSSDLAFCVHVFLLHGAIIYVDVMFLICGTM